MKIRVFGVSWCAARSPHHSCGHGRHPGWVRLDESFVLDKIFIEKNILTKKNRSKKNRKIILRFFPKISYFQNSQKKLDFFIFFSDFRVFYFLFFFQKISIVLNLFRDPQSSKIKVLGERRNARRRREALNTERELFWYIVKVKLVNLITS